MDGFDSGCSRVKRVEYAFALFLGPEPQHHEYRILLPKGGQELGAILGQAKQ